MTDPFEDPNEVLDEICSPYFEEQLDDFTGYHEEVNGLKLFKNSLKKKYKKYKIGLINNIHYNNEEYPSKYIEDYWIRAYAPKNSVKNNKLSGKWLCFCPKKEIDAAWQQVKEATQFGLLGPSSKVSTKLGEKGEDYVICVFTRNWKNENDVMRVRRALRELGFEKPISYKTDADTLAGKYAKNGDKNISKYRE